jgi:hypothetical protein
MNTILAHKPLIHPVNPVPILKTGLNGFKDGQDEYDSRT